MLGAKKQKMETPTSRGQRGDKDRGQAVERAVSQPHMSGLQGGTKGVKGGMEGQQAGLQLNGGQRRRSLCKGRGREAVARGHLEGSQPRQAEGTAVAGVCRAVNPVCQRHSPRRLGRAVCREGDL